MCIELNSEIDVLDSALKCRDLCVVEIKSLLCILCVVEIKSLLCVLN